MTCHEKKHRPDPDECDEYYRGYVNQVPDGDIMDILREQLSTSVDLYTHIPEEKLAYRYAPDKWTTREVIGHLIDTEWVFTYRALRIARGDQTPLPGMDQDEFVKGANFNERSMKELVKEYGHLRSANIALFDSFEGAILDRTGVASDCRFTVRSILYIIAGHEHHHLAVLKDRYL